MSETPSATLLEHRVNLGITEMDAIAISFGRLIRIITPPVEVKLGKRLVHIHLKARMESVLPQSIRTKLRPEVYSDFMRHTELAIVVTVLSGDGIGRLSFSGYAYPKCNDGSYDPDVAIVYSAHGNVNGEILITFME